MAVQLNRIDKLIEELCPEGVEFKELGEVWERAPKSKIGVGKIKSLGKGDIICFTSGSKNHKVNDYLVDGENIFVNDGGVADFKYYYGKAYYTDHVFVFGIESKEINAKFIYYFLKENQYLINEKMFQGNGLKNLKKTLFSKFKIPIPPLKVQEEIVKILDNFTELEARKKQYEHYREELLTFGDEVELVVLEDISTNLDSKRKPVTRSARQKGQYPYYGASGIVDYVSDYIFDGDYLLISEDGANLLARKTPIAFPVSGKSWINNHAHILKFKDLITQRYIEIYLNSIELNQYITGAAQPKLNKSNLNNIKIPFPNFEKQKEIVAILDKFDALVNDISQGLPAELKARRQQYEFYRNKLLTFKEVEIKSY